MSHLTPPSDERYVCVPNDVETGNSDVILSVDDGHVDLDIFEEGIEMHSFFRDEEDKDKQADYVKSERDSIRGWGNSRTCIPSIILSQCVSEA
eukprot:1358651-Prymnesium_polylepis.1